MSWTRLTVSFIGGTVVVLALLLVGLKFFYRGNAVAAPAIDAFEVELLTPEEAARLLGIEHRRRLPQPPAAAPLPERAEPPPER
ncbi:MAG: hypothetical protein KJO54_04500 [Gammaproteobacteria bacterium]|nr:hypothetical protein [Gammaproteobacteria bacterium]NNF61005.1 hypothetical protein [Gammaproteobacteria bacterium]NNM21081.1 hypothetical protein [Gammaproteobacteria bacterium]